MMLFTIFFSIALLLLLITWVKVNPFFAFIVVSIITGILLKIPFENLPKLIQKGLGEMLGSLSIIIIFGTCLGKITSETGAAQVIAHKLIEVVGTKNMKIGLMIAGLLIGIPMFYSIGFVLMVPLVFTLAKEHKLPIVPLAIPMLASLSIAHGFLPPHPSPVALIAQLKADMATTLVYGLIIAIPCILIAGLLLSNFLVNIPASPKVFETKLIPENQLPSFGISIFSALLPVFLLIITYVFKYFVKNESILKIINFVGEPSIAMVISLIVVTFTLGINQGNNMAKTMNIYTEAIKDIAVILLIMGGAGVFKEVLLASGIDTLILQMSNNINIHPYLLGWMVAAVIRLLIGSATIAGLMTATIILPIIQHNAGIEPNLMVLAIGAGSLIGSHINDPAFWMFKEYFNVSIKDTFKSWTVMESLVSVIGICSVFILDFIIK